MKNRTLFLSILLTGTFLTNSCQDEFLEKEPQGQFSPSIVNSLEGLEGKLVGAYGLLDGRGTDGVTQWHSAVSNWVFGGVASDDAYKGTDAGDQPEQTFIERYVWLTANTHIYGKWRHLYDGVARANDVLITIPEVEELSADRAAQIEAEARFLRAHYHFEAYKMWGNIPFIDDETWNPEDPTSTLVPNNGEEAMQKIRADFEFAMQTLPDTQADPGRPTRFAAMAYLAKTYMFTGFPNGQADAASLTAAKNLLDQIIASGQFELMRDYEANFTADSRNNAESIFEIQYSLTAAEDGGGNHGDGLAWPYNAGPGGCCGFYQPSHNLVNAYQTDENGLPLLDTWNDTPVKSDAGIGSDEPFEPHQGNLDPRLDHTVGRRGIPYKDWGIHPGRDWIRDQTYGGPFSPKKHNAKEANSGTAGWVNLNANNYRMIRYGMVLLWAAECEVEIGSLEQARMYVNMLRERAGNPESLVRFDYGTPAANYVIGTYDEPWTDQALARKAVRFETRLETAMEGHRFFDLVRWGIAAEVLNEYIAEEQSLRTYLNGASFTPGTNEYYPIPENAIIFSNKDGQATLQQNPGY